MTLSQFTVTASWGVYEPIKEKEPETGTASARYQRTPVEIPKRITVAELAPVGHHGRSRSRTRSCCGSTATTTPSAAAG